MAQLRHNESRLMTEQAIIVKPHESSFKPSPLAEKVLREGRIIDSAETPQQMMQRMAYTLFAVEGRYNTPAAQIQSMINEFGGFLDGKYCVMSTPVMTNAGRYDDKPLSACTVPPVDLRGDLTKTKELVNQFHEDGMGTGFNLDDTDDPVAILRFLNNVAVEGARSGREDRPVGNMAILSVHHPKIIEFIDAKVGSDEKGEEWKFNISVNASDEFMRAVVDGKSYTLSDGRVLNARQVMYQIVENAHSCGDPGLIFIDRLNRDNPTPGVGNYVSTAPCAEVGLAPGESCQFGYINLGRFINKTSGSRTIDFGNLERLTRLMTRALDNALELSIDKYAHPTNAAVMQAKRKIGVGICGVADLLVQLGIPYDSPQAREVATDVITFVNYVSKLESHELAKARGPFGAMHLLIGNRYTEKPGFLEHKYGDLDTLSVPATAWRRLGATIRDTRLLRNASTVALPPTGRSGLVIDASTGVEPIFSLTEYGGRINPFLQSDLQQLDLLTANITDEIVAKGRIGEMTHLPGHLRAVYQTALEIAPEGHLTMVGEIQKSVDESISKTVNMPENSSPNDILEIYVRAYEMGLKGITIFRTGSRRIQPRKLAKV